MVARYGWPSREPGWSWVILGDCAPGGGEAAAWLLFLSETITCLFHHPGGRCLTAQTDALVEIQAQSHSRSSHLWAPCLHGKAATMGRNTQLSTSLPQTSFFPSSSPLSTPSFSPCLLLPLELSFIRLPSHSPGRPYLAIHFSSTVLITIVRISTFN